MAVDLGLLDYLTDQEQAELAALLDMLPPWIPDPRNGPQCSAFLSPAFETLYGGAAGGGKSDLLLGLARTSHIKSLLLRREFPDLERSLISRSLEFFGDPLFYNKGKHVWEIEGRRVEFGHMERIGTPQVPQDEGQYASADYDFIGFDQLEQFNEYAYLFMLSRARSRRKSQRVRVMSSANPVGNGIEWIMKRWRAWLIDKTAKPGELLWYRRDAFNQDIECEPDHKDALSRTFYPAGLADNPYLGDDYRRQLSLLPEPLRSALLRGLWEAMLTDDAYQVIPRAWVEAAMKRWKPQPPEGSPAPLVVGVDVARGGDDQTVFAPRRGNWFDTLRAYPGKQTPTGGALCDLLGPQMQGGSANIDVIGVGASAYDEARRRELPVRPINFSNRSNATDRSGTLKFINLRAELYWSLRDSLDPAYNSEIMLPPDDELKADLTSVRWKSLTSGIQIEDKDEVIKRLGRSPDKGDAVVLTEASRSGWLMY